jgi:hypothetical protein
MYQKHDVHPPQNQMMYMYTLPNEWSLITFFATKVIPTDPINPYRSIDGSSKRLFNPPKRSKKKKKRKFQYFKPVRANQL